MRSPSTLSTLLAIIALLLGINIAVSMNRTAEALPAMAGPAEPVPVSLAALGLESGFVHTRLFRLWSDGRVDTSTVLLGWHFSDPPCEPIPGGCPWRDIDFSCAADVNGSGDVEFNDLVHMLATWGPCSD
jgi:hypothetical protein